MAQDYKVRIEGMGGSVVFEASSPLTESRNAMYTGFDIVHLPTNIHAYKNTTSRKWAITGKLVSRTTAEADANARNLDLIRRWLLPDFGGTGATGATPPICKLYAYGNKNINGRQVVIVSYDWTFTDEVDYIHAAAQPMPVIGQLTVNMEEVYSAEQITAREWNLKIGDPGEFIGGESGESSSLSDLTTPGGLMQKLGHAAGKLGGIQTVANALQNNIKPTLAGAIAGQLTRQLGSKIINSPQVQALASKMPTFARNIFVAGANGVQQDLGRIASQRVSAATQPRPPQDPFSSSPQTPPTIIGEWLSLIHI